jgi:enoyl-[acyl-carrier protein] reductase I
VTKGLMHGKRGLIMGVANDKSIAWGIASALHQAGAHIALSYQGEALKKRVLPLAERLDTTLVFSCDVGDEDSMATLAQNLSQVWPEGIDFFVHAIAYSDKNELKGNYYDVTRENFRQTMDISCYSFTAMMRHLAPALRESATCVTLTYYGAEKVMPHYNVMGVAKAALEASVRYLACDFGPRGIRVNAISAGPIRTLAASGIGDFRYILKWNEQNAPMRRNVTIEDVGGSALYLLSPLSSGVTGVVHHVDAGYHTVGMCSVEVAQRYFKGDDA